MPEATLLAFDYGEKFIGVALGNTLLRQARPLEVVRNESRAHRFAAVERLLRDWQPDQLAVGLPLTLAGEEQPASQQARRFANQLQGRYNLPVTLVDERGSSLEAQAMQRSAGRDDALAAAVILQRYLDALPAAT